jgi:hypothetical protein
MVTRHPLVRGQRICDLLMATIVALAVASPMLFTDSGFALDFTNHLWLIWAAGRALVQAGHPSYFLNAQQVGVFYPWFAFYGGSLYMIVGGLSELIGGHPIGAYVAVSTLTIAVSYLGMVWLGRAVGLRGWIAHAPALVVVTSAYYVTNLYGRGAWPEFMATGMIAPMLASGMQLVRAPTWRVWPTVVFVVSVVIFTGSHDITLVWGSTVGVVAGLTLWLALGRPWSLSLRRLAMVGLLAGASALMNAWYLLPDIAYVSDVRARVETVALSWASFLDAPQVLLDPLRTNPAESSTPALFVQVPVWFLVWGLVAGGLLLWRYGVAGRLHRVWLCVVLLIGLLLGMMMYLPLWSAMPFPFSKIQYPYRLSSYLYYAVAGLVIVGALALQRADSAGTASRVRRGLRLGLVGVCVISAALCAWQLWVPNTLFPNWSYKDRQEALFDVNAAPRTWYDPGSYHDNLAPVVNVAPGRLLLINPAHVHGDHYAAWLNAPPGLAPIQTNIGGGSYLVKLSGLTWVGRDTYGYAVVKRSRPGSGLVHVVLQTASSAPVVLGRATSVAACLVVVAFLALVCAGSLRQRRRLRGVLAVEA